jgi:MerR family copper efflux transcriptional regulator
MERLTIGRLAARAGIGVETIRFYERKGLIERPPRRLSGYRDYHVDAVERIRFIRSAKELGFSLNEIAELLSLRVDPKRSCGDVKLRASTKLADIRQKRRALGRMERVLTKLVAACETRRPTRDCPILEALEKEP